MAHRITAAIGSPAVVARLVAAARCPPPIDLKFGLQIVPLGHQQIDRLTGLEPGEYLDGFNSLSAGLQDALLRASVGGMLAYIETEYFGGAGSQGAAVLSEGEVVLRTALSVTRDAARLGDPINAALRTLGVSAVAGQDEFDSLGLGRFRNMEALGIEV